MDAIPNVPCQWVTVNRGQNTCQATSHQPATKDIRNPFRAPNAKVAKAVFPESLHGIFRCDAVLVARGKKYSENEGSQVAPTAPLPPWEMPTVLSVKDKADNITLGNARRVGSVAFDSDNSELASGDYFGAFIVWDADHSWAFQPRLELELYYGKPDETDTVVAYSASDTLFAAGHGEQISLFGYTLKEKQLQQADTILLSEGEKIHCVAWQPNGSLLASGSTSGILTVWDVNLSVFPASNRHMQVIPPWVNGLAFNESASRKTFNFVNAISFSPDGKWLACVGNHVEPNGSEFGVVALWRVEGHQLSDVTFDRTLPSSITAMAFSSDSSKLVIGGYDGEIDYCNVLASASSHNLSRIRVAKITKIGNDIPIRVLAWDPKKNTILAGGDEGKIYSVDMESLKVSELYSNWSAPGHIDSLVISPNGQRMAIGINEDPFLYITKRE